MVERPQRRRRTLEISHPESERLVAGTRAEVGDENGPKGAAGAGAPEIPYGGPDRRRHRVYVTRNTEYHFRDDTCVAVRDRRTGDFLAGHLASGRRLGGALRFHLNGAIEANPDLPRVGEALYLPAPDRELVTSPIERVERPSLEIIARYPGRRVA